MLKGLIRIIVKLLDILCFIPLTVSPPVTLLEFPVILDG